MNPEQEKAERLHERIRQNREAWESGQPRGPTKAESFAAAREWLVSPKPFEFERLFASKRNPARNNALPTYDHADYFRDKATGYPVAILCHCRTPDEERSASKYAGVHNLRSLVLRSWRPFSTGVLLLRAAPFERVL